MSQGTLLGTFTDGKQAARAIAHLRQAGFEILEVRGPVPDPAVEAALATARSPVRRYALAGGVLGCASGFALTSWTASQWGLIVGGKPVVALVPFAVIAFELTILFGALATLLGMLVHARLPRFQVGPACDSAFTTDRFGVLVRSAEDRMAPAKAVLRQAGAEEIQPIHGNTKPTTDN